ncbi:MAG: hypothetical protein ACREFP_13860 [Acetobacteraceae bacterium]
MQLRSVLLLAALLPAACATDHSPQALCRRQAERDPQIQALESSSAHSARLARENAGELAYLRREGTYRCLQDRGVVPQGGVEPVVPPTP